MKKLNNKGFVATSVLFGIVALLFLTFAIILGNSHATIKNDKIYNDMLKDEFSTPNGVKLYANGGHVTPNLIEIGYEDTYKDLPEATRDGYSFLGWFTAKNGGQPVGETDYYKNVLANQLYAHWQKKKYNLTINPNEGTYNSSTDEYIEILDFEEIIDIKDPTRVGYVFDRWELTGKGSKINNEKFQMGYEDAVLKAKWKLENNTLRVDPDGGKWKNSSEVAKINLAFGKTLEIPDPVREGYAFTGWTIKGEGSSLNKKVFTMGSKDSELIANWEKKAFDYYVKHYKEAITPNEFTLDQADVVNAKELFGTTIEPTFKTFRGFSPVGKVKKLTIVTDVSKNVVEYNYIRNKYPVKINPAGGNYTGELEFEMRYGTKQEIPNPTKTGYKFKNWSFDNGTLENKIFTKDINLSTLIANWTSSSYILTFDPNGGTSDLKEKEVVYMEKYGELPKAVKTGYTFLGWYDKITDGVQVEPDHIVEIPNPHTLYASWHNNIYKVILDHNDGTNTKEEKDVTYDYTYGEMPTLTKRGYRFLGWFTSPKGGVQITKDTKVSILDTQTLYAHWLPTDAQYVQYSNPSKTTCNNLACALDELFERIK